MHQAGHFTREFLAERVRFELTGLSSSGFQGCTGPVAAVRQRSIRASGCPIWRLSVRLCSPAKMPAKLPPTPGPRIILEALLEWSRHFTSIHPRPVEPAGRGSGVDLTGPIPVSATGERT